MDRDNFDLTMLYADVRLTVESIAEFCLRDLCLSDTGEDLSASEIGECVSSEGYVEGDGYCFSCIEYALGEETGLHFEVGLVDSRRKFPSLRNEAQSWDILLFDSSFLSAERRQAPESDWKLYSVVVTLKHLKQNWCQVISPPLDTIRSLYQSEVLSGILPIREDEELLLQ